MVKCEVLNRVNLVIEKGSVVLVSERQFETARQYLKPVLEEEKPVEKKRKSKTKE